ncbi:helix-turn-helix domain-containing protein [Ekhidna sp.]|uniref:helix-turn-helix domain-containing protein n=1 Tax=Ekhidna sp. TaxID=2608089 RepID=UPI003C7D3FFD
MINQKSIAVLPLDNLSSDPENEYFSDGMTEEIINALSKIDGLKVTARTSSFVFKNVKKNVRHIGNELGVALVLEGSVRKAGNRVRITTQLIRTDNGFQIWSESFDRKLEDIFALQDEISLLVAERIRENYGHLELSEHLVTPKTNSVEAYDTFLKGKYFLKRWNLEDIQKGALLYEKSAKLDPSFGLPLYGAGLCYSLLGSWGAMDKEHAFKRAEGFFLQGNKIDDPKSVYSYHCLATHEFWGLWDYRAANISIREALKIDPDEPDVNECLAEVQTSIGDFPSALNSIDKSLQNNPLSPNHFYTKANIFYQQRQYELAQKYLDKSLNLDSDFALSIQLKLACFINQNNLEGLNQLVDSCPQLDYPEQYIMLFHLINGGVDVPEVDVRILIDKLEAIQPRPLMAFDLFLLVQIEPAEGLELLKSKVKQKMGQVINFKHERFLDPIRSHPNYEELVRMCFPEKQLGKQEVNHSPSERSLMSSEEVDHFSQKLKNLMFNEHLYLDTSLTLRNMAETLNLHPNKLSWLLNEKLQKNFNDFINTYRLEAFQKKALEPKNSHLTLLGLAFESGFTSKSVFNDFFRKTTGLTPKQWVKTQQK